MTIKLRDVAFVIFKPDAVKQNLEKSIWSFIQNHGICLLAQKEGFITKEKRRMLYIDFHLNSRSNWDLGTHFFELGPALFLILYKEMGDIPLSEFITKNLKGNFVADLAQAGTIRGIFNAINPVFNLIHTSDSVRDTLREVQIFFEREQLKQILRERVIYKNLDLSHKVSENEELLSFEKLYYNIKIQLVQTFIEDAERQKMYVNTLENVRDRLTSTLNRQERKTILINHLNFEIKNILNDSDHHLLRMLAFHNKFVELDYELLNKELQEAGVILDTWEFYLVQTSMYYIHFL